MDMKKESTPSGSHSPMGALKVEKAEPEMKVEHVTGVVIPATATERKKESRKWS